MNKLEEKIKEGERLSEQEQVELIKSANVSLIKSYISGNINKSYFEPRAEVEFVKFGNVSLIDVYIRRYTLCNEAYNELLKLGDAKLVKLYNKRYPI